MNVPLALIALVSATLFACSGGNPEATANGANTPISSQPGDIGGSGPGPGDAGTPGRGTPDAGPPCNTQALPLFAVASKDGCALPPGTTLTNATIISAGCNDITIFQADGLNCNGSLAGALNAFSGICGALTCVSFQLPGTLFCATDSAICAVQICNDITGADCP